jgi:acyl-CoA thioester hydrolase
MSLEPIHTSKLKLRVRYSETDKMGFCYYGNYAQYFEVGRVEALRELGLSYKSLEDRGIGLPVRNYSVEFKKPARYDDEIQIITEVFPLEGLSLPFKYQSLDMEGNVLNTASTELVFMNLQTGRPMRVPEDVLAILTQSS